MKINQFVFRHLGVATLVLGVSLPWGCGTSIVTVPADPVETCVVPNMEFDTWFETGAVSLNGVVTPANSVTFSDIPNCDFYKWSERMFLWLTSPAPPRYGGGGGRIFNSPAFYDVSPPDASGDMTFIPHAAGRILNAGLRAAQVGALGLPLILDRSEKIFSIEPGVFAPNGRQLILNAAGERVEIARATISPDGRPIFLDAKGQVIRGARPIIRPEFSDASIAQRFVIDGVPILLGISGAVIDVEQGQAGGGQVLMARNGSLVYFRGTVNDVFAYFLTGTKNGAIPPPGGDVKSAEFPKTQAALDAIVAFASANGKTLVDPQALAIEVKTSWIETAGLDVSRYVTLQGTIPTYDTTNPNLWVQTGQKTVELAMVGMHVVGSTKGHSEMIWATFEHVSATPNAQYAYNSTSGAKTVNQDTAGNWLFTEDNSMGPFNEPHMRVKFGTHDIESIAPFTISPSNTIRWKAWGKAHPANSSNTELISINNSVIGKLVAGDVRKNYIMTGATWTISGQPPTGSNQVGTNKLANTTMETYQQGSSNGNNGMNCFTCHGTNKVEVSHLFCNPLFPNCAHGLKPLF